MKDKLESKLAPEWQSGWEIMNLCTAKHVNLGKLKNSSCSQWNHVFNRKEKREDMSRGEDESRREEGRGTVRTGTALPWSCASDPSPKPFRHKQIQQNKLQTGAAAADITHLKHSLQGRTDKQQQHRATNAHTSQPPASSLHPELASSRATL